MSVNFFRANNQQEFDERLASARARTGEEEQRAKAKLRPLRGFAPSEADRRKAEARKKIELLMEQRELLDMQ